jgi:RimJ/RimL family protein N-acetyltransferase
VVHHGTKSIRFLEERDASAFRLLRLEALRELPELFSATYAEERELPREEYVRRFKEDWISGDNAIIGAFQGTRLVGGVGLRRWTREKQRHKAYIWILYVELDARGSGTGRQLLDAIITYSRDMEGLDQVQLSVSAESHLVRSLYASNGFRPYGREQGALKIDDRCVDLELMALYFAGSEADAPPIG